MTNPFAVQPGKTIQDPLGGIGGALSTSLAGVLKAMQDKEKLQREQAEFESKQAYFKTLDTGNQLENEQKREAIKTQKRTLDARSKAGNLFAQVMVNGDLEGALAKERDPDVIRELMVQVTDFGNTQKAQAEAKKATAGATPEMLGAEQKKTVADADKAASEARVSVGTEGSDIASAANVAAYNRLRVIEEQRKLNAPPGTDVDPATANAALAFWKAGGVTRGQAWGQFGLSLPGGVDPAEKFEGAGKGGLAAAQIARNQVLAKAAGASNLVINELGKRGVKMGPWTSWAQDKGPGGSANVAIPEDVQQLVNANRIFSQMYGLFVTGQASSEQELQRIIKAVTEYSFDKPGVVQQKAIMRQVMLDAMNEAFNNKVSASTALQSAVENAEAMGLGTDRVMFLREGVAKAIGAEAKSAADASKAPVLAPHTDWDDGDYDSVIGARQW